MSNKSCHLKAVPFGLAFGIVWGLAVLLIGWLDWWTGSYGSAFVNVMSSFYLGFKASFWGGIIGLIWGFFDAFIAMLIVAWIYNGLCCVCSKSCSAE